MMQRLVRDAMHAGALGFSTAPQDRGDPGRVGDRRRALGTRRRAWRIRDRRHSRSQAALPVAQGDTQDCARPCGPHRSSDRSTIWSSQPIATARGMDQEHLSWLEDVFNPDAAAMAPRLGRRRPDLRSAAGTLRPAGRGSHQSRTVCSAGMPTWDKVMALPYQESMQAFRDPEIRKSLTRRGGRRYCGAEETGRPIDAVARAASSTVAGIWCRSS